MRHPIYVRSNGKIEKDLPIFSFSRSFGSFAGPLRRNIDYSGIARRALVIEPLPNDALPSYDTNNYACKSTRGFRHNLIVVNSRGKIARNNRTGFVTIPKFEIFQSPMITIGEVVKHRSYRLRL